MFRAEEVLARIKPGDRVLDVGGWASPFNRANWILDIQPFVSARCRFTLF